MPVTTKKPKAVRETRPAKETAQNATEIARQSVDQAQAAFDAASDIAHDQVQFFDATAGALKSNAAEFQLKAIEIAQANTNAAFSHLRKLLAMSQPTDVLPLAQSFVSEQTQAIVRQAGELNELAVKFTAETVKPLQDGLLRSFDGVRKSLSA